MEEPNIICNSNSTMNKTSNPAEEEEEEGTSIMQLPVDTMHIIFLKLQAKPLFRCRCVCQVWRSIINHSYSCFADKYRISSAARQSQLILFSYPYVASSTSTMKAYAINPQISSNTFTLSQHPFDEFHVYNKHLQNLGHGLFLIEGKEDLKEPSFLYNPVTCEKLLLPLVKEKKEKGVVTYGAYGLGFNYSTKQYKLVRTTSLYTEVYILGSNKWKQISAVPPSSCSVTDRNLGEPAYGDIHWYDWGKIVSFIVTKEEFKITPLPDAIIHRWYCLINWKEDLALLDTFPRNNVDMWVLRDYDNTRWEKLYALPFQTVGPGLLQNIDRHVRNIGTWEEDIMIHVTQSQPIWSKNRRLSYGLYRCNPKTGDITVMNGPVLLSIEHLHSSTINLDPLPSHGELLLLPEPKKEKQEDATRLKSSNNNNKRRENYKHESSINKNRSSSNHIKRGGK